MKKLLNLRSIFFAALLVAGLTGIVSFVSASGPIATVEYGEKKVEVSNGQTKVQVDLHEFGKVTTGFDVQFKISTDVKTFKLTLSNYDGSNPTDTQYTIDQEGNIHVDLSEKMNGIAKEVYGVYTLNFIDEQNAGEKSFSIDILVDKKDPIVQVSLGGDSWIKSEGEILGAYANNKLIVKVKDENFDPRESKGNYNIPGIMKRDWIAIEDGYMEATFELAEGENKLNISVTDEAGNKFEFPYSEHSFVVDTKGPVINVKLDGENIQDEFTNKTNLTINIQDEGVGLDFNKTQVSVNDKQYSLDRNGNVLDLPTLVEGDVSIEIAAYDTIGNKSEFNISKLVIDKVAPIINHITFNNKVLDERYFYDESQIVSIEIDEENFEENGLNFESFTDELNKQIGTIDWQHNGTIHTATFIPQDGEYKFSVTATDKAQNKSDEQFLSFMIDTVAPEITVIGIESSTEKTSVYPNVSPKIIVNDVNFESAEYTLVKNDEVTDSGNLENNTDLNFDVKEEGHYTLSIIATDKMGRESRYNNSFIIDTTSPEVGEIEYGVPIQEREGILYFNEDNRPTFRLPINDLNIDSSGIDLTITKDGEIYKGVTWTLDSVEESSQTSDSNEEVNWTHMLNIPFTDVEDGTYKLTVKRISDKAGNEYGEPINPIEFVIDTDAPTFTVNEIKELSNEDQQVNISVDDLTFTRLEYTVTKYNNLNQERFDFDDVLERVDKVTIPAELIEVKDGEDITFTVQVTATDIVGHSTEVTKTFTIDKVKPVVTAYEVNGQVDKNDNIHYFDSGTTVDIFINEHHFDLQLLDAEDKPTVIYDYAADKEAELKEVLKSELEWIKVNEEENIYKATVALEDEGYYYFKDVKVIDNATNKAEEKPEVLKLAIDGKAPEVEFKRVDQSNNEVEGLSNKTQKLEITVNDITYKESTYSVIKQNYVTKETETLVDNETIAESTIEYTFTEDGTYTVDVTAFDWAGHQTTKTETFTIDKVNPVVSKYELNDEIRQDANGVKYYKTGQSINIYIDEYHFDPSQVEVDLTYQATLNDKDIKQMDVAPTWKLVDGSNDQYVATIEIEKDGYYELKNVQVEDDAKNKAVSKPNPEKVVIDTVMPNISVDDIKNEFYYKKGDAVTVNVSIDEINFNPELSTYEIYRKETLKSEEKLYLSGNITSQTDFKLPTLTENGEYRIILTAKDMSDNKVEKDTELHFYIDHNNPKVSIKPLTANTANGSQQNVSEVVLGLSATDDWKLSNTEYTVKRNGQIITVPKQGEWEDFKLSFKEEGFYQVELQTNDEAGNGVVTQSFEFTIDRTSPAQLNIVGNANHHNVNTVIADGGSYSAPRVNLNFAAQDLYSFDYMSVNVLRNGSLFAAQTFNLQEARSDFDTQFSKDVSYSLSEEGEYEVTFTAYDQAGNKNDQKVSFEIDRTAPVIDSNIEDGKYYNSDFLPEFNLDQPDRDEFTFINIDDTNYKGRVPVLASDKVYTISALATDKAQNTTDYYATLTVDKTPPAIGISNLISGFFKDTLSPSIFYSDTNLDSSTVSIKLNNVDLGPGVGDENGYTKEIAIDKDGTYSLEITVGDLATNVSKQTIDFVLDNESPTIIIKNPITLYNQPWIPELEVLEEYGYDIVMATLNGVEHDITQPITTEGKNVLFIEVMDKSGNISSLTLQFILDLTPPKVIVEDAATNQLIKDGDHYLTNLDLKIYLDYVSQEGQEDTERITKISLNGEDVADRVTLENGRKVYRLSVTEFKDYTLEVTAVDDAQNKTVEVINFTLGDKDIFTKIYENKPVFYSLITITGLAVLGSGVYGVIVLKSKSKNKEDSSEE